MTQFPPPFQDLADRPRCAYLDTLAPGEEDRKAFEDMRKRGGENLTMAYEQPMELDLEVAEEAASAQKNMALNIYRVEDDQRHLLGQIRVRGEQIHNIPVQDLEKMFRQQLELAGRLLFAVREEDPGVVGRMFLALKAPPGGQMKGPGHKGGPKKPWQESVPETPDFGSDWQGGGQQEGYDDGYPNSSGPKKGKGGKTVAMPIGRVIRFEEDLRFPNDLSMEARDMLGHAVAGDLPPVRDRLIEQLTSSNPDSSRPDPSTDDPRDRDEPEPGGGRSR